MTSERALQRTHPELLQFHPSPENQTRAFPSSSNSVSRAILYAHQSRKDGLDGGINECVSLFCFEKKSMQYESVFAICLRNYTSVQHGLYKHYLVRKQTIFYLVNSEPNVGFPKHPEEPGA